MSSGHVIKTDEYESNQKQDHFWCFLFYFVSEAPKFKNNFFVFFCFLMILLKSSDFNGFDHISSLVKYDMMIFFSGFFSSFRIFPDFHQIFRFLHRMDCFLLTYDITIFFSGNLFGFRIFSGFSSNLKIYSVS